MQKLRDYLLQHLSILIAGALIAGGVWYFFGRDTRAPLVTAVATRSEFVQQVAISGKVVAARSVDLGFSQGGRIAEVDVHVGQEVSVGTPLASIENGDLRAMVQQRKASLDTQQARLASLQAGTRPEQIAVTQSQVASSQAALLDSVRDAYRAADGAVHNTIDQFIQNPGTNPRLSFSVSDSESAARVESGRVLAEMMLSSWQRSVATLGVGDTASAVAEAKKNLAQVATLLSDANDALNHAIPTVSNSQAIIDGWTASISSSRAAVNVALSSVTSGATALDTQQKNLALQQSGATPDDVAAQVAEVEAAKADLASAQAQLAKTLIVAPFSGVITTVEAKVGSIASSNGPQVSMITDGTFQIETYIPEVSIVNVKVGNAAVVKLDAYGDATFDATVLSIDPAETIRDGVSTYKTTLQFAKADSRIRSGMTASASITTASVPGAIAIPKAAVYQKGDLSYVQVKLGRDAVERQVTIDPVSSLGSVVVTTGVAEGDAVVLNPTH